MDTTKLPKWAQDHIKTLERQRDEAVSALNEYVDHQTESAFYFDDYVGTGETLGPSNKRSYIQTRNITVNYAGIELNIYATPDNEIRLQWSDDKRHLDYIYFIPTTFQGAILVSKKNVR
jgi:hypothetical protein